MESTPRSGGTVGLNLTIEGGRPLTGTVVTNASKNGAVVLLAAALLNRGRTTIKALPKIEEVNRLLEVLASLGVEITHEDHSVTLQPPQVFKLDQINVEAAKKTRSILLFIGSLIHAQKNFKLPYAGGCQLGERTVRPHLFALEQLGVKITARQEYYDVRVERLKRNQEIVLYEMGDTVTENLLLASSLIAGPTTIKFASSNYMVQELCWFLTELGVVIKGIGTSTLRVFGLPEIKKDLTYHLSEDPIESMLFLALAATTGSSLTIKRAPIDFLALELLKLQKMGFKYKLSKLYKSQNGQLNLVDIQTKPSKLKALEDKIHPLPYPGINIDNLPFFVPIATQAKGQTLIHDWVYENRAIYYLELTKLGASIILADPHRVIIDGPTELKGTEIICPPALRPAAIILIAMLAAKGKSILRNIYSINRGYEDLVTRLKQLGAKIDFLN